MLYTVIRKILKIIGRLFFRLRIIGVERIPGTGPILFAPNHVSYLDIPMMGIMVPRPLHFMGKTSLFRGRLVGWVYRRLNGFSLERGPASREGLMEAVKRLKQGHCVVMYPEGSRSHSGRLQRPLPGIGMVAALSGVPVIPVYVSGTDKALPVGSWRIRFCPITVVIGEPVDFKEQKNTMSGKDLYLEISRTVMARIATLEGQARSHEEDQTRIQGPRIRPEGG